MEPALMKDKFQLCYFISSIFIVLLNSIYSVCNWLFLHSLCCVRSCQMAERKHFKCVLKLLVNMFFRR